MARFLAVIVVLAILLGVPFFLFGDAFEQSLSGEGAVAWLKDFGSFAWLVAIGLLIADLALPVPSAAVMGALGIVYGPVLGGLIATTGSVCSGLIGYGVCRRYGRPVARWFGGEKVLADGETLFAGAGGWIVVLSRWLPVFSEVIACVAGLARMAFKTFLVALLCGSVPLGFVFAAIGHAGQDRPVLTLALCAVLPIVFWLLLRPFLPTGASNRGGPNAE